ncbi:hypothetical protein [Actinoalloteichus caeruleus]|uniref:Anti-sigma-M factor RsmA n=1 Tax=Actinoalloteichus caeruleus DSM 43889 TaxID=1120930 RepID=A0ABT1JLE7_ACTCY|nr:hypothetical protein [Actinoalloteichus caeruleus]MCP2332986.1 hypothetical protein [Actinoalloteichus caeruleus DSM 43889]
MTRNEWEGHGLDPASRSRPDAPADPSLSLDVLADLHGDVLDAETARELTARIGDDPDAKAVLDALDAVHADLAAFGSELSAPTTTMPPEVAARLERALADEAAAMTRASAPPPRPVTQLPTTPAPPHTPEDHARPPAPVADLSAARRRRNRMLGWGSGVLAAAAVAAVVAFGLPGRSLEDGTPMAQPPATTTTPLPTETGASPGAGPLALTGPDDVQANYGAAMNAEDYGPFGDEAALTACLRASGVPDTAVLGSLSVNYQDEPALMVVMSGGDFGSFRVAIVSFDCGPDSPGLLTQTEIN